MERTYTAYEWTEAVMQSSEESKSFASYAEAFAYLQRIDPERRVMTLYETTMDDGYPLGWLVAPRGL